MATAYDRPPHTTPTRDNPDGAAAAPHQDHAPGSLGELVGEIAQDLSALVREEINLAKAELKEEGTKAGKAGGLLAGAGYAAHLLVLFLSLTAVFALAHAVDAVWAALIVAALWGAAAAVLYARGRTRLRDVNLKPEHTVQTLKEDAAWARHPTS